MQNTSVSNTNLFDVFISHASESSLSFVEKLANWFETENGIKCWYAPRNLDNTGAGKDYADELVYAIEHSRCIVVVLNDDALQSKWVRCEVNQADDQNKRIIPFAISELSINNGLRMELSARHIIAAYPHPEEKFPLLLKNVQQLLRQGVDNAESQDSYNVPKRSSGFDFDYDNGITLYESNLDKDAFMAFLRSAQNGNQDAMYKLVEIAQANWRNKEFLGADTWQQISLIADEGNGYAELLMHFRYYSMGSKNKKAIEYLKKAIQKFDSPIAYLQLGLCYDFGVGGIEYSDVLAKKYYEIALSKGCVGANYYLGQMYLYGTICIEKNHVKAEEYLRKGVEEGDEKCLRHLLHLYAINGTHAKAHVLAQDMVDRQVRGGYTVMGDYFHDCAKDQKQAEKWYQEACKHEENRAWGKLAYVLLENSRYDEAYRYAQKGYLVNDSLSFAILGSLCEYNEDYEKAWDYYHQMSLNFGQGHGGLARLYIDYNYHPDNYNLVDLKRDLELSVKLQNVESVKYLLKVLLIEKNKDSSVINFDILKDIPESYEILRLGANVGDCDSLFIYGRLLLESDGDMFNPFRGIEFVESAAEKGNKDAIFYAFEYYKNDSPQKLSELSEKIVNGKLYAGKETKRVIECFLDKNKPSIDFIDWLYRSLRILVWEDVALFYDCFKSFKDAIEVLKENVKDWIDEQVDSFLEEYHSDTTIGIIYVPFYAYLLGKKLSLEPLPKESSIIQNIREIVDIENDVSYVTKIPHLKDHIKEIWPDYNRDKILEGNFSNDRDLRIFYGTTDNSLLDFLDINENDQEDSTIEVNDYFSSVTSSNGYKTTKTKSFFAAYTDLLNSYENLVKCGCAQSVNETLDIQHSTNVCCSLDDTLYYGLKSIKMLIASRSAFGNRWQEVVAKLSNTKHVSDMAESFDIDVRHLLRRYCDFAEARNELFLFNMQLAHGTCSYLVDAINAVIDEMAEDNDSQDIPKVTEEDISEATKELKSSMFEFSATLKDYLFIHN